MISNLLLPMIMAASRLPWFTNATIFSKRAHNQVIKALNPLLSLRIVRGSQDKVTYSDQNVFISLKSDSGSEDGVHFKDEYDFSSAYNPFDIVRVSPANSSSTTLIGPVGALPGVYIAAQPVPHGNMPRNPIQSGGENSYWRWMATWPTALTVCDDGVEKSYIADAQENPS